MLRYGLRLHRWGMLGFGLVAFLSTTAQGAAYLKLAGSTPAERALFVKTMTARDAEGKHFGVIVLAEGMAELLPMKYLKGIPRDEHGHISISHVNLGRMFAKLVSDLKKGEKTKAAPV